VSDENKAIVERFMDALFTHGDLAAVEAYLAPEFVNHDPLAGQAGNREGMKRVAEIYRAAFPDWRRTIHDLIAENDRVVERFSATGTHEGEFMGLAATGTKVTLHGINIFRLADGKIVERWGNTDQLGFLRQLGLVS
jgi:steroid delta-isomerase-like uncharacterized protein